MKGAEIQKALETLGLTEYETKAYICLVEKGTSTAGNLSKLTEIPHSKIYEVLMRLEKRNLIEAQKGRPLLFKAIKPSTAIEAIETQLKTNLQNEYTERKTNLENTYTKQITELSDAQKLVIDELDGLFCKNEVVEPSEDIVWTIHGKANLDSQAQEIILSAQTEVRLRMPYDDFSEVEPTIKAAHSKGVNIQLLVHRLTSSVCKLKENAEIFIEESPLPTDCGIILADHKKGMFISENYTQGFRTAGKSVLMVLNHFYDHELEESIKVDH